MIRVEIITRKYLSIKYLKHLCEATTIGKRDQLGLWFSYKHILSQMISFHPKKDSRLAKCLFALTKWRCFVDMSFNNSIVFPQETHKWRRVIFHIIIFFKWNIRGVFRQSIVLEMFIMFFWCFSNKLWDVVVKAAIEWTHFWGCCSADHVSWIFIASVEPNRYAFGYSAMGNSLREVSLKSLFSVCESTTPTVEVCRDTAETANVRCSVTLQSRLIHFDWCINSFAHSDVPSNTETKEKKIKRGNTLY